MQPTVVISLEIELAWGVHHLSGDHGLDRHSDQRRAETETLERLLSLCDRLDLPITFDVVGHLLLEECSGRHTGPHSDGWFADDPGTDIDRDPLYYAPDLVRRIQNAETEHEIGTHTFSHVNCQHAGKSTVDWELNTVRSCHEDFGVGTPRSFVPSLHAPCQPAQLQEHGIESVRQPVEYRPPVTELDSPDSLLERIPWRLEHAYPIEVLFRSHPVRDPDTVEGVIKQYTTWHASLTSPSLPNGQSQPHPFFRFIPTSVRQRFHERYLRAGLERAIAGESCAHFWSHLFNCANEAQWAPIESFLVSLADKRDQGCITVSTMDALTKRLRGRYG